MKRDRRGLARAVMQLTDSRGLPRAVMQQR